MTETCQCGGGRWGACVAPASYLLLPKPYTTEQPRRLCAHHAGRYDKRWLDRLDHPTALLNTDLTTSACAGCGCPARARCSECSAATCGDCSVCVHSPPPTSIAAHTPLRSQEQAAFDALPKALEDNAKLRAALDKIARMHVNPDKRVLINTLKTAIHIAQQAKGTTT